MTVPYLMEGALVCKTVSLHSARAAPDSRLNSKRRIDRQGASSRMIEYKRGQGGVLGMTIMPQSYPSQRHLPYRTEEIILSRL